MNISAAITLILLWRMGISFALENGNSSISEIFEFNERSSSNSTMVHSRRKRYIVFPKGASLQLVYCNTYLMRPVVDIFRFGMTVGLAWQLPDDPQIYSDFRKNHKIYKRNALKKVESFMRPGGANGKQCVLKALCESGQRTPAKKEFLKEILHTIFSYNEDNEDVDETHDDKMYRKAHQSTNQDCDSLYPECEFSIFKAIQ